MTPEDSQIVRDQAAKIVASGALGRSRSYQRLFNYLVENSLRDRAPKEMEIAAEVFARNADFDPSQDSMVRVYAHNLRQKIRQYYENGGSAEVSRIYLPRGEYRLGVEANASSRPSDVALNETASVKPVQLRWPTVAVVTAVFVTGLIIGALTNRTSESSRPALAAAPLWQEITDDDLPVQVVAGDYYIFGELDDNGDVVRIVREFAINSRQDLDAFITRNQAYSRKYQDLNLTYLAQSTAASLGDVLSVLYAAGKSVNVVAMSEFDPAEVRTSHIVYVGYFSALDKLFDFAFAASKIAIGDTFDELWNIETGAVYSSGAGRPADYRNYRDYGYFSTFPGPGGNQFAIIAGTRDEGVMHVAQIVTDPMYAASTAGDMPQPADSTINGANAFELLYEVTGFDRTHIDAVLVHASQLDASMIWRGTATPSAISDR